MVFKPSELTPLGALKLAEILHRGRGARGPLQRRAGPARWVRRLHRPRVAKVSLTGSVPTGRKVYAAAAAGMKHVTMELGGKSPLVVFDDADLENAVGAAINGNFYSSGQVCSNGTRVFVQDALYDAFLARLAERLKASASATRSTRR
jgi:betaine-aldehyde dehydrogenase